MGVIPYCFMLSILSTYTHMITITILHTVLDLSWEGGLTGDRAPCKGGGYTYCMEYYIYKLP